MYVYIYIFCVYIYIHNPGVITPISGVMGPVLITGRGPRQQDPKVIPWIYVVKRMGGP